MRKHMTSILLIAACLALFLTGCGSSGEKVPVTSVAEILGIGPIGMIDRHAGVVEAGEMVSVESDGSMELAEIAVSEGDTVTKGQVLFTYETTALSLDVERMQLEVEQMNNGITTKKSQIKELEKEQKTAASADKLQYTLQIQQLELDIKEAEYNVATKKKDIERTQVKLAAANVLSPVDGRIKKVNTAGGTDSATGQALPLITITQAGDFRVRGTVNELGAQTFAEGTKVVIRSRVDDTVTWTGTVSLVDWENPISSQNDMYYMPSDEMTTSSKYPFYVTLDSDLGLMLGQHVYIEQDLGQALGGGSNTLYLPAYYLNDLETEAWVWAANEKDKLEKRTVTLGNYDMTMDTYEVLEGLSLEDYIAYPEEDCTEGAWVRYPEEEELTVGAEGEEIPGGEEGELPGEEGELPGEEGELPGEEVLPGMEGELPGMEDGLPDAEGEESPEEGSGHFYESVIDGAIWFGDAPGQTMPGNAFGQTMPGDLARTISPGVAVIPGTEAVG